MTLPLMNRGQVAVEQVEAAGAAHLLDLVEQVEDGLAWLGRAPRAQISATDEASRITLSAYKRRYGGGLAPGG